MSTEERFSHALHNTARMWRLALDRRLKDLGVSQAGWLSIAYIAKAKTPLSQGELAGLVQVEAATMVSTIDRLEKAGLVRRVASETDRRVKHLIVTPQGQAIYDKVRAKADDMRRELLGRLDAEKLKVAADILEELQTLIESA
ncbi:MarR family transcriptional regulator [Asticcacaulis sp. 201]|uniref:MarR family winged helix-turn-helix transcriptional regulator n=1 Tax=Asticcacaulis sp. 201 TaxID=3028787 RepID=UPI002915FE23|nr:MarR family transcriptional regulator [Asticcacaulis sp. 201]MDV6329368.1 MarR family transcriptional regulator [Asticcacaulis sp. 201]